MIAKITTTSGAFEQWGWPQAAIIGSIAGSIAFCVWCVFDHLSRR